MSRESIFEFILWIGIVVLVGLSACSFIEGIFGVDNESINEYYEEEVLKDSVIVTAIDSIKNLAPEDSSEINGLDGLNIDSIMNVGENMADSLQE